ncbi:MAG: alpha-2-macroglobulin family protein [Halothiobacillaceae bacterium]|nr:MAG: alpha-2-macroglobulin family protein [Halothiobacillaceae bacterium]
MKSFDKVILGLLVALTAAAVAYVLGHRPASTEISPVSPQPAVVVSQDIPAAVSSPQPSVVVESQPDAQPRLILGRSIESGDNNEICLIFSAPLAEGDSGHYADFLKFDPDLKVALRVEGSRLCFTGLNYGVNYQLRVLAGLSAANGAKLAEDETREFSLGDFPARVAFNGGFILPRETQDGLPLSTMNVEQLELKLYRVGDRLLARMQQAFVDQTQMMRYEADVIGGDSGQLIWSGTQQIKGERNKEARSLVPLPELMRQAKPGAYVLVAQKAVDKRLDEQAQVDEGACDYDECDGQSDGGYAAQWIVHTDMGLGAFRADDGLTLVTRSLASARPVAGTRLTLIARNNEELGVAETDAEGKARFPAGLLRGEGGLSPVMVMAYRDGDFAFLDLRRAPFDLSDRGVAGRAPAGPMDTFLYTDRGIYRPGETVHLVSLLRDSTAHALSGHTVVVKLMRPNGKEYRRYTLKDEHQGAVQVSAQLPASAQRGAWRATLHTDPEAAALGEVGFEVQDFVPQRLGLTIGKPPAKLRPGEELHIPVEARFLYGAPASSLGGEAELILEPEPAPFPGQKGFHWGREDERFNADRVVLEMADTDESGHTAVTGTFPASIETSLPLRADIGIAVREPGGRSTGEHLYLPVRTRNVYLGLRPLFDSSVPHGQGAGFEVIAVDADGQRVAVPKLEYRFMKDDSTWQWHKQADGRWQYERIRREKMLAQGEGALSASQMLALKQIVSWGEHRLIVRDGESGAEASMRFYGGWYGYGQEASADRPDRLKIAADRPGYMAGDVARLHIDADFAGEGLLVMANERVHEVRNFSVSAGGGDIDVPVSKDWGAGAYALVTLYRPVAGKLGHAPVRAVGVTWLGLNPAARTIAVEVQSPDKIKPRQHIEVPVKVSGGRQVHLTLSAVDQGILQLTRFQTPAPHKYYLGQRRLGVGMLDDYGRLIRGLAALGEGEGGDGFGGKGLDVVPVKSVALFSGILTVPASGVVKVPLDIPDFQGELRLMAVAYDDDRTGSGEARLTVRDPVVAELILPRFLAPGDAGAATVLLHNVEGEAGQYRARVAASGPLSAVGGDRAIQLAQNKREVYGVPLKAGEIGTGAVTLEVSGPGGFSVRRDWPIQVRAAQHPISEERVSVLKPGQEVVLSSDVLQGFLPGSVKLGASFSRFAGMDIPGQLKWLDRYPYGCLEQTTSRAMPLIYFNEMAVLVGQKRDRYLDARVQDAVDRVLSMQNPNGGFNMWGPWGNEAYDWIGVFAMDFLYRAADKGFDVPRAPLEFGQRWLDRAQRGGDADVRAYAASLLAPRGLANAADLRYFHDQNPPLIGDWLGPPRLGLAGRGRAQPRRVGVQVRHPAARRDGEWSIFDQRLRHPRARHLCACRHPECGGAGWYGSRSAGQIGPSGAPHGLDDHPGKGLDVAGRRRTCQECGQDRGKRGWGSPAARRSGGALAARRCVAGRREGAQRRGRRAVPDPLGRESAVRAGPRQRLGHDPDQGGLRPAWATRGSRQDQAQ